MGVEDGPSVYHAIPMNHRPLSLYVLTQTQEVFDTGCKAIYLNNVSWTEYEKPYNVPRVLRCILIKRRLSRPPCEVARALHIKHSVTPRPDQYNYAARQVSGWHKALVRMADWSID